MNLTKVVAMGLLTILFGCGGGGGDGGGSGTVGSGTGGGGTPGGSEASTLSGLAAAGAPLSGRVYLKDSSTPPKEVSVAIASDGTFTVPLTGTRAPYFLKATGPSGTLYSFSAGPGRANINPVTDIVVASAGQVEDPQLLYDSGELQSVNLYFSPALSALRSTLRPVLLLYGAESVNPHSDRLTADHKGFDHFLDDTEFSVVSGRVMLRERSGGKVYYEAPLSNLGQGVVTAASISAPSVSTPTGGTVTRTALGGYWVNTMAIFSTCNSEKGVVETKNLVFGGHNGQQNNLFFFDLANFPSFSFTLPCTLNGTTCSGPGSQGTVGGMEFFMKPYTLTLRDDDNFDGYLVFGNPSNSCEVVAKLTFSEAPESLSQMAIQQISSMMSVAPTSTPLVNSVQNSSNGSVCRASCDQQYQSIGLCDSTPYASACKTAWDELCVQRKQCYQQCGSEYYASCGF